MVLVLDNFRSRNNIGAAFRTADAFAVEAIYLCGISATPPHREIQKTALGATESVVWKYTPNTLDAITTLKTQGYQVVAVEQTPRALSLLGCNSVFWGRNKWACVFGNEVTGVGREVLEACHFCIEIPQWGSKKSLNVAVSIGVVLWHYISHHKQTFAQSRNT